MFSKPVKYIVYQFEFSGFSLYWSKTVEYGSLYTAAGSIMRNNDLSFLFVHCKDFEVFHVECQKWNWKTDDQLIGV